MLDRSALGDLAGAVAAMADAATPSDVFRALLDSSRLGAERRAIFLLRQGTLRGWAGAGYEPAVERRLRELASPAEEGWLGRVCRDAGRRPQRPRSGEGPPDFGQPPALEAAALPVRVGTRTVAVLLAERLAEDEDWSPEVLESLVTVAGLRLDLDLLRRRTGAAPEPDRGAATGATVAETPGGGPPSEPSAAPAPAGDAEEPAGEPTGLEEAGPAEPPELSAARRYARLIATDIRLYNEEAVMLGRRNRDLEARLAEQLERGRETFARRYGELGERGLGILHEAYVQVLAAGDAELLAGSAKPR